MAKEQLLGRPKKFDEETSSLTVRLPESLRGYVDELGPIATDVIIEVLRFDQALNAKLKNVRSELVMNAAQHGVEYSKTPSTKAETIGRLVLQALGGDKKSKK